MHFFEETWCDVMADFDRLYRLGGVEALQEVLLEGEDFELRWLLRWVGERRHEDTLPLAAVALGHTELEVRTVALRTVLRCDESLMEPHRVFLFHLASTEPVPVLRDELGGFAERLRR